MQFRIWDLGIFFIFFLICRSCSVANMHFQWYTFNSSLNFFLCTVKKTITVLSVITTESTSADMNRSYKLLLSV